MVVSMPCHEHPGLVSNVVHVCAERVDQGLPLSLSTPVHYLPRPEPLGIAWLLHYTPLAVRAKTWLFQGLA